MKKIKNNNSGFTLVELIIAMAVLAFLMTAVGSLMGSSVASHRKQKAEIRVHTSAQQTYNQITDSIMQAKDIVIVGYLPGTTYNFSTPGADMGAGTQLTYFVKDEAMVEYLRLNPKVYGLGSFDNDARIIYFSDLEVGDVIYAEKIAIMTSVPIDLAYVPNVDTSSGNYVMDNSFISVGSTRETVPTIKTATGTDVFKVNDDMVNIYTFEGSNMYYEKQYKYMTDLNDVVDPVDGSLSLPASPKESCIYNTGFSYVETTGTYADDITGCVVTVDVKDGAIGVELMFNDRNMTYTTNGMINLRNSYVLKGKDN